MNLPFSSTFALTKGNHKDKTLLHQLIVFCLKMYTFLTQSPWHQYSVAEWVPTKNFWCSFVQNCGEQQGSSRIGVHLIDGLDGCQAGSPHRMRFTLHDLASDLLDGSVVGEDNFGLILPLLWGHCAEARPHGGIPGKRQHILEWDLKMTNLSP